MNEKLFVEVIEFTDPICTWCWGSEPILRKLETFYEGNIKISFIVGGLIEDIRTFRDDFNGVGGDLSRDNENIAKHWLEASGRHGMPVEVEGFNLFSEEYPSSFPGDIAYKAAQFQDEKLANRFLRRMREAAASEARKINRTEVLIELADECGLDVAKFIESFSNGTAEKAFREDREIMKNYKVFVLPTFLVRFNNCKEVMLKTYKPFDTFKAVIDEITNRQIVEKKIKKTKENIMNFIKKYEHVAPVEIAVVFDLTKNETDEIIKELEMQKLVKINPAGNGYFVTPYFSPFSCNTETGACHI